jgi:hypothetical protein
MDALPFCSLYLKGQRPADRKNYPRFLKMLPVSDRPSVANHIDDANRQCAVMKLSGRLELACRPQNALLVNAFQENHGFGPRDNKKCNPGSDGANVPH